MSHEKLVQLEYRDDTEYQKLKPTVKQIKETPYMQNNPDSQNKVTATMIAAGSEEEQKRKQKQDQIDALKKTLMQPRP